VHGSVRIGNGSRSIANVPVQMANGSVITIGSVQIADGNHSSPYPSDKYALWTDWGGQGWVLDGRAVQLTVGHIEMVRPCWGYWDSFSYMGKHIVDIAAP
jgi:hypothetical protein